MAGFKYQLEKSTSRAQFEADRLRRTNKARAAADGVRKGIKKEITLLGQKALELAVAGETLNPSLQEITDRIVKLQADVDRLMEQIKQIKAEVWIAPPPPPPPPPPAPKPAVQKPEPRHKQATQAPDSRVAQRLMEYINEEVNSLECPKCHTLSPPDTTVCRNCGHRFRDPDEEVPSQASA